MPQLNLKFKIAVGCLYIQYVFVKYILVNIFLVNTNNKLNTYSFYLSMQTHIAHTKFFMFCQLLLKRLTNIKNCTRYIQLIIQRFIFYIHKMIKKGISK